MIIVFFYFQLYAESRYPIFLWETMWVISTFVFKNIIFTLHAILVLGIITQAMDMTDIDSICSFCSRLKRGNENVSSKLMLNENINCLVDWAGRIYQTARKNGYNVIALGQHLDDLAESFLMYCMSHQSFHFFPSRSQESPP